MSRVERPRNVKARREIPARPLRPTPLTPLQELVEAFNDAVALPWDEPHPPPTSLSIKRIEQHFGLNLPPLLIEFARASKSLNGVFAALGPDYQAHDHIVRINSYWRQRRRTRRIPRSYVIFTIGHDDQFWCLDKLEAGELAIQFWCPDKLVYCSDDRPVMRYASFEEYLSEDIRWRNYWKTQRC